MVTSTRHTILLKKRHQRKLRRQLLLFFDVLALHVSVGHELFYAWGEALEYSELFPKPTADDSMNQILKTLESSFPLQNYQFTFSVLRQLYGRGATLGPALQSFSRTLRRDLERDIEAHLRTAPTRSNICLLLFFLPPALVLVIFPFLQHLRALMLAF